MIHAMRGLGVVLGDVAIGAGAATSTISVSTLQKGLKVLGFDPGPVDGIWGARTARAFARAFSGSPPSAPAEGATSITVFALDSNRLTTAAARYRAPAHEVVGPAIDVSLPTEEPPYLWYAAGGVALLAVGYYLHRRAKRRRRR